MRARRFWSAVATSLFLSACQQPFEDPKEPLDEPEEPLDEPSAMDGGIAVASAALSVPPEANCAVATFGGNQYWFCTQAKAWSAARTRCQSAGLDLARIDSAAENAFVYANLPANAWLGANDQTTEGAWRWVDNNTQFWSGAASGSAVSGRYANWATGQPDSTSQDCGALEPSRSGKWADRPCTDVLSYVCERPLAAGEPAVECQTSGPASAAWPSFRRCLGHQGRSSVAGPPTAASVATYTTGGEVESSPAIDAQGVIYVGSFDGYVYALNPDLTLKWRFSAGAAVRSSPALAADGTIVVGASNGRVYAIKPDGTQKWQYTTGGPVRSSPAIAPDGTIYVGSDDFYIYALNATGTLKWRYATIAVVRSTPAISPDGTIYAGSDDWSLTALNPNGTVKWVFIAFGPVSSSPALGPDGTVYVGSYDGFLYALHPGTGTTKWAFSTPNSVTSSPAIAPDGSIVFGNDDGVIRAVRPDGTLKWSRATGGLVYSSPAIDADGVVYVGSYDNNLYALAAATGAPIWTSPTGGDVFSSPALSKGLVYVGSYDRKLYAVGSPCAAEPCSTGEGPCANDNDCDVGLVCGHGIGKRYGKPDHWGVCWNPGICGSFDPKTCGQPGSPCGTTCCVPDCGAAAGTPDGCGGTCRPCVAGADSDRDGLLDCAERADPTRWTNPVVNNGVKTQQGATCHATPTCSALASMATVDACFVAVETQDLSSGWDFNTTDLNVCAGGFGFAPSWHSCREDFGVRYEASILLQTSGRHCFEVAGLTENQCGALFINDAVGELRIATGQGAKCLNLDAGIVPLRWFYETTSNTRNELHIRHCAVTSGTTCVPTKVPTEEILPPGEHPPNLCDIGGCSALCPCNDGEVCDPTKPNGFCQAHLRCQVGPGTLFGRTAQTPVCYDPVGCNPSLPTLECGSAGDRCGNVCPTCPVTPSCTGKSCGSNGCYGSCGATCGAGQAGCATDADCASGLVCLVGAGARFGLAAGLNVCAPDGCRSASAPENPCMDPARQGQMTECGRCPTLAGNCEGKDCGPNGAGGTCGATPAGHFCAGGVAMPIATGPILSPLPGRPVPTVTTTNVGTLPGNFSVDHGGQPTYRVPLDLPKGRGGLAPPLALTYSLNRGNNFVGNGWALEGMQAITRCPRTVAQDVIAAPVHLDSRDAFCLNGERLVQIGTRQVGSELATEYATENNEFASILSFAATAAQGFTGPARFTVTHPNGDVLTFGGTTNSRVLGPIQLGNLPRTVQTWAISRLADRFGNFADYLYEQPRLEKPDAYGFDSMTRREYYPTAIHYSRHASDTVPHVAVLFGYEARQDAVSHWRSGSNIQINRLLKTITVLAPNLTQIYRLSHEGGANGAQSVLGSVQLCAGRQWVVANACMTPTTFQYEPTGTLRAPVSAGDASRESIVNVLDFDGDGRDDLLTVMAAATGNTKNHFIKLSRVNADQVLFQRVGVSGCPTCSDTARPPYDITVLDWDNDGRDDLVDLEKQTVYRAVSDQAGARFEPISIAAQLGTNRDDQHVLIDLNGDSLKDLLRCNAGTWSYGLRVAGGTFGAFSAITIPGGSPAAGQCPAIRRGDYLGVQRYRQVIDVDGDSAQELLFTFDERFKTWPETGVLTQDAVTPAGTRRIFTQPRREKNWFLLKVDVPSAGTGTAAGRVIDTKVPWYARTFDMNGDSLPDFFAISACPNENTHELCSKFSTPTVRTWINTGGALEAGIPFLSQASSYTFPYDLNWRVGGSNFADYSLVFLPDGYLAELGMLRGSTLKAEGTSSLDGTAKLAQPIDYDGDGYQDLLLPAGEAGWMVLRAVGTTFELRPLPFQLPWDYHYTNPSSPTFDTEESALIMSRWQRESPTLLDLNGDGVPDFLRRHRTVVAQPEQPLTEVSEWQVMLRAGPAQPRLKRIVDGLGEGTEVDYAPLADDSDAIYAQADGYPCQYPVRCAGPRRNIVRQHRVGRALPNGGLQPKLASTYSYRGARTDAWGRGFLGFSSRSVITTTFTSPIGYLELTDWNYDNRTRDASSNLYYKAFVPTMARTNRTVGTHWTSKMVLYDLAALSGVPAKTVHRVERQRDELAEERQNNGPSLEIQRWRRAATFDKYGNPLRIVEGVPGTTALTIDASAREGVRAVDLTYAWTANAAFDAPALRHLALTRTERFDQAAGVAPWGVAKSQSRATAFEYYSSGAVLRTTVEPGAVSTERAPFHHVQEFTYDGFGNTLTTRTTRPGADARVRQSVYATTGVARGWFPIETINEKNQRSAVEYDERFGALNRVRDPNGVPTEWYYDDFGRLAAQVETDSAVTGVTYTAGTADRPLRIRSATDDGLDETIDYDSFGRAVHSVIKGFNGADLISDSVYDDLDRVLLETRPHREGADGIDPLLAITSFGYDALGRQLLENRTERRDDNSTAGLPTETCYSGRIECTRTPRGFNSCLERDRLGRVIKTWDMNGTPYDAYMNPGDLPTCTQALALTATLPVATTYGYGEFLERIADKVGNLSQIVPDRYGRTVTRSDPDTSVTRSAWNAFGELESTTDATGQVVRFEYDVLGRTKLRRDVNLNGPGADGETRWFFDGEDPTNPALEAGELLGTVTLSRSPEGHEKRYRYDSVGRMSAIEQKLAGSTTTYAMRFEEYRFGNPQLVRYPAGSGDFAVRRTYDNHGRLTSVKREGTTTSLWTLEQTGFYDQPLQERFGSGVVTSSAYDNLGRLREVQDRRGTSTLRIAGTSYDRNSNVSSRRDANHTDTLLYDRFDRLVLAQQTLPASTQSGVVYDDLGNITSRTDTGGYFYQKTNTAVSGLFVNAIKPHAVTRAGDVEYDYDQAGNLTLRNDAAQNIATRLRWTPFGKIAKAWNNGATPEQGQNVATFSYDAEGQRVRKQTAQGSTEYLEASFERRQTSAGATHHVYFVDNGERVIAQFTVAISGPALDNELLYLHSDRLGSHELITDSDGNVEARRSYDEFGKPRNPANWSAPATGDTLPVRIGFTGHERDDEYGLVNMGGRHYDPVLGRFISPDPFVQSPFDSQGLNRYSYVFNNPTTLVDPTGFTASGPECSQGSCVPDSNAWGGYEDQPDMVVIGYRFANPTVDLDSVGDFNRWQTGLDILQLGIGVAGLVPGFGEIADGANAAISLARGDYVGAALDAASAAAPVGGQLSGVKNIVRRFERIGDALKNTSKLPNPSPGAMCFAAGTLVHTKRGLVPIEEVEPGEPVWSRDDATGEITLRPVVRRFVTPDQPLLELELDDGSGNGELIRVTAEHPFHTRDRGWVSAAELRVGDEIVQRSGGFIRVSSGTWAQKRETVYNFEVAEAHTYFVGELGAWVHNMCKTPGAPKATVAKTASGKRVGDFTPRQKIAAKTENAAANGGTMACTDCGREVRNIKSEKGVSTPPDQAQVHHDPPLVEGGSRDSEAVVLCPGCHAARHSNE